MDGNRISDLDSTMLAKTTFEKILEQIKESNLNFYMQLSPFSASISLKKSFVKDRFGNILPPAEKISQSDFNLQHENAKLIDECERHIQQNKSQSKTINILEEKIAKMESATIKAFNEKTDEVINLKKSLEKFSSRGGESEERNKSKKNIIKVSIKYFRLVYYTKQLLL